MPKAKIYVAGPMRGYPKWNFPAFDANAAFLADMGWDPISPADLDREIGFDENDDKAVFTQEDFNSAMRRDYEALLNCYAIAFIPGWEKSTGAGLERDFAAKLGLEMYRVDATKGLMQKEQIIGICGFAQSGKDTLANMLTQKYGFERRGFADSLKGILYDLNPIVNVKNVSAMESELIRVKDLVDRDGWESAKKLDEVRSLLQRLGTEGGRKHIHEDVWNRVVFERPHSARLVIPDVRFPNEADAIHARGGKVIRVLRPGYEPVNAHISEVAYTGSDYTIDNTGTPEDMLRLFDKHIAVTEFE